MTKREARPVPLPEGTKLTDKGRPQDNIKPLPMSSGQPDLPLGEHRA